MKDKSSISGSNISNGKEHSGGIRRRARHERDFKAISEFKSLVVKFPSKIETSSQAKKSSFNFRNYSGKKSRSNNPTIAPTVTRISASTFFSGSDEDDSTQSFTYDVRYADNANNSISQRSVTAAQYSFLLSLLICLWLFYLLLPKGLRRSMCNAYPKRHTYSKNPYRRLDQKQEIANAIFENQCTERNVFTNDQRKKQSQNQSVGSSSKSSSYFDPPLHARTIYSNDENGVNRFHAGAKNDINYPSTVSSASASSSSSFFVKDQYQKATLARRHLLEKRSDSGVQSARMNLIPAGSISDQSTSTLSQRSESFSRLHNNHHQTMSSFISPASTPTKIKHIADEEEINLLTTTPKPFIGRKQIIDSGGTSAEELKTIQRSRRRTPYNSQTVEGSDLDSSVEGHSSTFGSLVQTLFFGKSDQDCRFNTTIKKINDNSAVGLASAPQEIRPLSPADDDHQSISANTTNLLKNPSPHHPDPSNGHKAPSQIMLSSTMIYLRDPGIQLQAHGTRCKPRRIWMRLDPVKEQLTWRTENPNEKVQNSGIVTLGPVHEILLKDILYVDVGKTTAALRLLPNVKVTENTCFSLLTKSGSLDLQAGNSLERDALVSCFCMILDTLVLDLKEDGEEVASIGGGSSIVGMKTWRDLYDTVLSSASGGSTKEESSININEQQMKKNQSMNQPQLQVSTSTSSNDGGSIVMSTSSTGVFSDIEQLSTGISRETYEVEDMEASI